MQFGIWHKKVGERVSGKLVAETKLLSGFLSPTWMTSAAEGVYSFTKISLTGT